MNYACQFEHEHKHKQIRYTMQTWTNMNMRIQTLQISIMFEFYSRTIQTRNPDMQIFQSKIELIRSKSQQTERWLTWTWFLKLQKSDPCHIYILHEISKQLQCRKCSPTAHTATNGVFTCGMIARQSNELNQIVQYKMPEHKCRWDINVFHENSKNFQCEETKTVNMAAFLITMWGSLYGLVLLLCIFYRLSAPQNYLPLSCGFFEPILKGLLPSIMWMMLFLGLVYFIIDVICRCCCNRNQIYEATNEMKRLSFAFLYIALGILCTWAFVSPTTWKFGPSSFCMDVIRLGNDSKIFNQNASAYFQSPLDDQIYQCIWSKLNSNLNQSVLFLGISEIGKTVSLQRVLLNISTFGVPEANLSREQFLLYYYSLEALDYSKQNNYIQSHYRDTSYNLFKIQSVIQFQKLLRSLSDKKTVLFFIDSSENVSPNTYVERFIKRLSDLDKSHSQFHLFLVTNAKVIGSSFYTDQYFLYDVNNFVQTYLKSTPPQLIQKYFRKKGNYFKFFRPQFETRVKQMQSMYQQLARWCNNYEEANYLYGKILTEYETPMTQILENIKNIAYNSQIAIINNMNFLCNIFFGEDNDQPRVSLATANLNKILFNSVEMRSKILQIAFIQKSLQNKACQSTKQKKQLNQIKKTKKAKKLIAFQWYKRRPNCF